MKNWEYENDTGIYFWGGILSNWAKSNFIEAIGPVTLEGRHLVVFCTAEQYMMRMKADLFNDKAAADKIMETRDPKEQKAIGRTIKSYSDDVWDPVARDLTYPGIYAKFDQNKSFKDLLLDTGDKILVEASPFDKKWGIGLSYDDLRAFDKSQWQGTNWLGHMLMKVRDDLRNGTKPRLYINDDYEPINWKQYE